MKVNKAKHMLNKKPVRSYGKIGFNSLLQISGKPLQAKAAN
jgi:hypothetical protein